MKLSDAQVVEVRSLYEDGVKQEEIAKRFDLSQSYVSYIVRWKRRASIGAKLLKARSEGGR